MFAVGTASKKNLGFFCAVPALVPAWPQKPSALRLKWRGKATHTVRNRDLFVSSLLLLSLHSACNRYRKGPRLRPVQSKASRHKWLGAA
jgi:hypothetical protein